MPDPRTAEERRLAALLHAEFITHEMGKGSVGDTCALCEQRAAHLMAAGVSVAALAVEPVPTSDEWRAHGLAALEHLDNLYYDGAGITATDYRAATDAIRAALAAEPVPVPEVDAAWEALLDDCYHTTFEPHRAVFVDLIARHRPIIEAAIRQSPSIDVERLARALDAVYAEKWPDQDPRHHPPTTIFGGYAEDIAAEYARLATPPEPKP